MARNRRNSITVDLSEYDPEGPDFGSGAGGFHIPEGEYAMECTSVEKKVSKNDSDMLEWIFTGTEGKAKGKKFYLYTVFTDFQKMGNTLAACGQEFDQSEFTFSPDDLEGAEVVGIVIDDKYQGEKRSKLQRVMAAEEEEKPKRNNKDRRSAKKVKMSEDEVKELDEDDLEELVQKYDLDVDLSKAKTHPRKIKAVIAAMSENDLIA